MYELSERCGELAETEPPPDGNHMQTGCDDRGGRSFYTNTLLEEVKLWACGCDGATA